MRFEIILGFILVGFCVVHCYAAEENFVILNGMTGDTLSELGPHVDKRTTPCSTFKIALCLMGYDAGILVDEITPELPFKKGYVDYLDSWKASQTPQLWLKNSCVWYSQLLATQLGMERIEHYLYLLEYGNQDFSGGLTTAWLNSSLKISPKEQAHLVRKMHLGTLRVSPHALQMTKSLLFHKELPGGWKLYGKTGGGQCLDQNGQPSEMGWFVGWIEQETCFFPFAYNICAKKIDLTRRIPRAIELLRAAKVF